MRSALLVLFIVAACSSPEERLAEETAVREAVAAARTEVTEARACIWVIGRLPPHPAPDSETGLPLVSRTCEVDDRNLAATDAHNDEIRRAWREGRVPVRRP